MQTENDTTKPEDSPEQEAGEGCSGATCSANLSDGGAAFPVPLSLRQADGMPMTAAEFFEGGNGMTLRDYFAAQSLAGICQTKQSQEYGSLPDYHCDAAKRAYGYADAMLAFRCKQNSQDQSSQSD
jgi:hypothetical protein